MSRTEVTKKLTFKANHKDLIKYEAKDMAKD